MNNPHTGWTAFLCGDHEGTAVGLLVKAGSSLAACALMISVAGCSRDEPAGPSPSRVAPATASASSEPVYPSERRAIQLWTVPPMQPTGRDTWWSLPGRHQSGHSGGSGSDAAVPVLGGLADSINQSMKLPNDIALKGAECGEENAFWSSADQSITVCYEYADWALKTFTNLGDPDPAASARGLLMATFYHETGHMASSIYDLPTTGREEDVADQAAAFILLQPGDDGRVDQDAKDAVMNYARGFQQDSEDRGPDVPRLAIRRSTHPGQGPDVQLRVLGLRR